MNKVTFSKTPYNLQPMLQSVISETTNILETSATISILTSHRFFTRFCTIKSSKLGNSTVKLFTATSSEKVKDRKKGAVLLERAMNIKLKCYFVVFGSMVVSVTTARYLLKKSSKFFQNHMVLNSL